jgi:hypothetical protein
MLTKKGWEIEEGCKNLFTYCSLIHTQLLVAMKAGVLLHLNPEVPGVICLSRCRLENYDYRAEVINN